MLEPPFAALGRPVNADRWTIWAAYQGVIDCQPSSRRRASTKRWVDSAASIRSAALPHPGRCWKRPKESWSKPTPSLGNAEPVGSFGLERTRRSDSARATVRAMKAPALPALCSAAATIVRAFCAWAGESPGTGPLDTQAGGRDGSAPLCVAAIVTTPRPPSTATPPAATRAAARVSDMVREPRDRGTTGTPCADGAPRRQVVLAEEVCRMNRLRTRPRRAYVMPDEWTDARQLALELTGLAPPLNVDVMSMGLVLEPGERALRQVPVEVRHADRARWTGESRGVGLLIGRRLLINLDTGQSVSFW